MPMGIALIKHRRLIRRRMLTPQLAACWLGTGSYWGRTSPRGPTGTRGLGVSHGKGSMFVARGRWWMQRPKYLLCFAGLIRRSRSWACWGWGFAPVGRMLWVGGVGAWLDEFGKGGCSGGGGGGGDHACLLGPATVEQVR